MNQKHGRTYRVEWIDNGQWEMELNNSLTFDTREEAQRAVENNKQFKEMKTRIVEVLS